MRKRKENPTFLDDPKTKKRMIETEKRKCLSNYQILQLVPVGS